MGCHLQEDHVALAGEELAAYVFVLRRSLLIGVVGDICQGSWLCHSFTSLSRSLVGSLARFGKRTLDTTYTTSSTSSATASSATAATATARARAAFTTLTTTCTFTAAYRSFCLFACRFRFASKLNGDFAFQYFFARQLIDRFLCLFSSLKVDESITDRSVCAWVDRDGSSFTVAGTVRSY